MDVHIFLWRLWLLRQHLSDALLNCVERLLFHGLAAVRHAHMGTCTHGKVAVAAWEIQQTRTDRQQCPFPHGATATPFPNAPDLLFHRSPRMTDWASRRSRHIFSRRSFGSTQLHGQHGRHEADTCAVPSMPSHLIPSHPISPHPRATAVDICTGSATIRTRLFDDHNHSSGTPPIAPTSRGTQYRRVGDYSGPLPLMIDYILVVLWTAAPLRRPVRMRIRMRMQSSSS